MNSFNTKKSVYFISLILCIAAILVTINFIKQNSSKELSHKDLSSEERQLLTSLNGNWYSEIYNEKISISVKNSDVIITSNNNSSSYKVQNIIIDKKFIQLIYENGNHRNFTIIDKSTILLNGTADNNQIGASEPTKWNKI